MTGNGVLADVAAREVQNITSRHLPRAGVGFFMSIANQGNSKEGLIDTKTSCLSMLAETELILRQRNARK